MKLSNLELISKSWFWLEQHKNDEVALGQFADMLIANKSSLAKYRRKIILFLQKIDYIDPLFNGEIGLGKLEVDGVNCCWLWNAAKNCGYGQFCIENNSTNSGMIGSNRVMLFLIDLDFELDSEEQALHKCDNPPCVNPNHLFAGTHQDNMDDKVNKNRQQHLTGINNGNSKLTDEQVWAIFYDERVNTVIAEEYGVSSVTISLIKRGERQLTDLTKSLPKNQNLLMSLDSKFIKITREMLVEILELRKAGWYLKEIADKFGVSKALIGNILNGKYVKRFGIGL